MFPTGGSAGWSVALSAAAAPPVYVLPADAVAVYFDVAETGGLGTPLSSLSHHLGATTCIVLTLAGTLEARFRQPNVYGINLLDRIILGADCALVLTVFDDDGITPLWEVGSAPDHAAPYLINPENYGQQEVDFAAGAATLGTVSVGVIDPAVIPGDQDGGWLTERLARFGYGDIAGRRSRLIRFISTTLGEQVIADGPAGAPSMDASYAAFTWEIRDTRETERKVRLFEFAGNVATGLRSLVPDELIDGYGYDAPSNTYLIRQAMPLQAQANRHAFYPTPSVVVFGMGTLFPDQVARQRIWQEAYNAVIDGIGRTAVIQSILSPNIDFLFRWRAAGSSDAWTEVPGEVLGVSLTTNPSVTTEGARVVINVAIEDHRLNPSDPLYDPLAPALPTENQVVEFFLLGVVPTNEKHPVVLDSRVVPGVLGPLDPSAALLLGRFALVASIGGISSGLINLLAIPGNAEVIRRQTVPVFERLGNESTTSDIFIPSRGTFSWRAAGSSDPWTNIILDPATGGGASLLAYIALPLRNTFRVFTLLQLTAADADVPTDAQDIEFTVTYAAGAPELLNLNVGVTAGQLAKNVYDGLYAPRGPVGELVPMRVRYDEAALLQMTDLVRLRLTEPVDDARDFLEKFVYAPTGWAPALNAEGEVSPVSQVAPTDSTLLSVMNNEVTEPSPDWSAGSRIINILRFTYQRDFTLEDTDVNAYPDPPQSNPADPGEERQKVMKSQPELIEFRDEVSIARHGEQALELDGSAFTAIGKVPAAAAEATLPPQLNKRPRGGRLATSPVTSTPLVRTGAYVLPVSGDVADEVGYQLALLRQLHLHNRYSLGAPAFGANVMRSALPLLRAGSWLVVSLSWLPDYVTQRRGLVALGQVLAIGDLDCAWRHVLIELVVPLPAES